MHLEKSPDIASPSGCYTVAILSLPRTMTEPVVDLMYHQRRVGMVVWHPTANNVLLSAGSDNIVVIWNVGCGEALSTIDVHPDIIYSCCFNWDGSLLLTTCKDKKIRIINPRDGEVFEVSTTVLYFEKSYIKFYIFVRCIFCG